MGEMKQELEFKLQAYLDGELPAGEAREMAEYVARDADARALLTELKNTQTALAGHEPDLKVPETREFYWSKIERDIRRLEKAEPTQTPASFFVTLRRLLIPAGALAGLLVAVVLVTQQLSPVGTYAASEMEMALTDSEAFTYQDYSAGMTLVWVTFPAENDFADFN